MQNRAELYAGARKFISGLNQHQNSLAVMHVTAAVLQGSLDNTQAKERSYQSSRDARKAAIEVQTSAKTAAQDFALDARDVLKPYLGRTWSVSWTQAGFKNN